MSRHEQTQTFTFFGNQNLSFSVFTFSFHVLFTSLTCVVTKLFLDDEVIVGKLFFSETHTAVYNKENANDKIRTHLQNDLNKASCFFVFLQLYMNSNML